MTTRDVGRHGEDAATRLLVERGYEILHRNWRCRLGAREIAATSPRDVVVVAILKGSFIFAADLIRALHREGLRPEIDFIFLASYGGATVPGGEVRVLRDVELALAAALLLLAAPREEQRVEHVHALLPVHVPVRNGVVVELHVARPGIQLAARIPAELPLLISSGAL